MMRSLWTAASGMTTQQLNVDTISNNLANVNTVGYKKERLEFKSLLYQTMRNAGVDENGQGNPVPLQVGSGVRAIASHVNFTQGTIEQTDNAFDFAIDGKGFFVVAGPNQEEVYTRDGSFKLAATEDGLMLTTSDGYPILSTEDEPIVIEEEINIQTIEVGEDGIFRYIDEDGEVAEMDIQMKIVQFSNPAGLEKTGSNFFRNTTASGDPLVESEEDDLIQSSVMSNSLEVSNVQVVEEMVKLIVAQRAYDVSSKAIQSSDDMLAQANQLKR